jgi:hypothetical protein
LNPLVVTFLAALGGLSVISFSICALFMARLAAVSAGGSKGGSRKRRRRSDRQSAEMTAGRPASRAVWI